MRLQEVLKKSENQILKDLSASSDGLTESEVKVRQEKFGHNILKKAPNLSLKIFLNQFKNSLFYILLAAAIISYALKSFNDFYIIIIVLLLNTALSFYQEYKSEKAVYKLQKFLSHNIIAKRSGTNLLVDEKNLVPGDIVILKEGDIVPADIRLLEAEDLMVNESQLSGESAPLAKLTIKTLSPRETLLFAGSTIEKGEATGVVFNIGEDTELGKIADLSSQTQKKTKYEQALEAFSGSLIKIVFITLAAIFIAKIIFTVGGSPNYLEILLFIVALTLAAVPEALPIIATVTLSLGALKLARHHVIVKSLEATEDFGNVNILCTDKTGTLTENKMVVTKITSDQTDVLEKFAILSTGTEKVKNRTNPFYEAIFNYIPARETSAGDVLIKEIPFDSALRRSRVIIKEGQKHYIVSIGSVETLLDFSVTLKKQVYLEEIKNDGLKGLRHLGFSYKEIDYNEKSNVAKYENDLKFLGFFTFEDPLKKTAKGAVLLAEKLGVSIKILSGDSPEVTQYVATQIGLIQNGGSVLTGAQIEKLSDEQLANVLKSQSVFARLNPEQKFRIIRVLKRDNTVAYQGDGINDAPSMKLADVSIAVNSATDIAKENADIILLRNDLEVVVNGLKYGRAIFANTNKYIRHTMIGNFGNFFALAILFLFAKDLPLTPVQLLLTNLLTDLPVIAIATDSVLHTEMAQPSKYDIKHLMNSSIVLGAITAIFILIFFVITKSALPPIARTELFLFITISQLAIIFTVRTQKFLWTANRPSIQLIFGFILTILATVFVIYFPSTSTIFSFARIPLASLTLVFGFTILYLIVLDIFKVLIYKAKPVIKEM